LGTFAITAAVVLLPACASKKPASQDLPPYGATAAYEQGLTPEEYEGSIGEARLEKFVAMYRLLAESEARARSLERRLAEVEPGAGLPPATPPGGASPLTEPEAGGSAAVTAPPPPPGELTTVVLPDDQQLVVTALREELVAERAKRDELQAELNRMRAETSAGPYEREQDVALQKAEQEIATLQSALRQEGQARDELQREYEALRAKVRSQGGEAAAIAENASLREQIARLKAEQEQEIASIRQDLEASRQREAELKATLAATEAADAAASETRVAELEEENRTLRSQIEQERQRAQELEAKLKVATRVSDLIFRLEKQEQQAQ